MYVCRGQLKCDGTRAETRFRLSAKRTSPFKSAGGTSVQSTTGSRGVRISGSNGSNAGYTMFRGSVKSTGYPLHHASFPLHFPNPASRCAITFQLGSNSGLCSSAEPQWLCYDALPTTTYFLILMWVRVQIYGDTRLENPGAIEFPENSRYHVTQFKKQMGIKCWSFVICSCGPLFVEVVPKYQSMSEVLSPNIS
jgi:hypothetical protein